ncbi:MAG: (d)CMP kinase [Porphyromonas sp.]|nr:(d)CMP kinase [Bacteroidales bacterium]MDY3100235.1 (d)CMP kinase [Porphyromonas sp.]
MNESKINIAIDGYSSTGKSTIAKELARALGYTYIDTGAMYRGVTLFLLEKGLWDEGKNDLQAVKKALEEINLDFRRTADGQHLFLNGRDVESEIRGMWVSNFVSPVSAVPEVRAFLVARQQAMAKAKGVVMDGRDVGTTVLPDAELKIFMTSRPEVRVRRRYDEMIAKGKKVTPDDITENLKTRDLIDSTREVSPLRQAVDARLLDNSDLTREEQNAIVLRWAKETIARNGRD